MKIIDPASGVSLAAGLVPAYLVDESPRDGQLAYQTACSAFSSTGTKRAIAFYRPGERDVRPDCATYGNLVSDRCMPKPGDYVAEAIVDIVEGETTVVKLTMEPNPR